VIGTAAGGFATGLGTLMAARVLAGAVGGPATSLSLSIVADVIPAERRGKAMGAIMGAFSVASILGVPIGLELARLGGFRAPFFAVAGLGLFVAAAAIGLMPPMRAHLAASREGAPRASALQMLRRPAPIVSLAATATIMMASFTVVPNLSAYVQHNLGYPRDRLGLLYLVGGAVSFFAMRGIGRLVDRVGAPLVSAAGTALLLAVLGLTFVFPLPSVPVMALFVGFMVSHSFRNVAMNTLSTRVPFAHERARFLSMQSAVQHVSAALGAFVAASMLSEADDHRLVGIDRVALLAMALATALPFALAAVQSLLRRAEPPAVVPVAVEASAGERG
jgi:predicted MFS family arabinose efflux permease